MPYEVKKFDHLLGIKGLSDQLLNNHFGLYQGYVTNFNKLDELLMGMEKDGKFEGPEYSGLNRRLGWEWNGMRLHEYYFENITKEMKGPGKSSLLPGKMKEEWGSPEIWKKDFIGMAAMRGIGWIVMYYDKLGDRLFNVWINEHDTGHLSGAVPLLVLDVFEHAYMLDYGTKRADYIDAFCKMIDWPKLEERFQKALK
jgi:superoxide dismutase, Fe-Mn family